MPYTTIVQALETKGFVEGGFPLRPSTVTGAHWTRRRRHAILSAPCVPKDYDTDYSTTSATYIVFENIHTSLYLYNHPSVPWPLTDTPTLRHPEIFSKLWQCALAKHTAETHGGIDLVPALLVEFAISPRVFGFGGKGCGGVDRSPRRASASGGRPTSLHQHHSFNRPLEGTRSLPIRRGRDTQSAGF
jgi:hypothetical protein